jgi:hypothetical protein
VFINYPVYGYFVIAVQTNENTFLVFHRKTAWETDETSFAKLTDHQHGGEKTGGKIK